MSKKTTAIVIGAVVVGLFLGAYLFRGVTPSGVVGSAASCTNGYTCFTNLETQGNSIIDGTFTLGSAGTALSKIVAPANCAVIANAQTITASTSKDVDCTVTGLVAGDNVVVTATTSTGNFEGLSILASRASTTAGYVTMTVYNGTGGTFTWTNTASTSFKAMGFK